MKTRHMASALLAATMLLSSCGNSMVIGGKVYETFGVANQEAYRDPNVVYEISAGSVIVAIIFCETIFIPVYVVGWDLWQPVRAR